MKQQVESLVTSALERLVAEGFLPGEGHAGVQVERTRDRGHGDFSSNAALVLAKRAGVKPRDLAARLVATLPPSPLIERVEVAGPGFVNLFLSPAAYQVLVPHILTTGAAYGCSDFGAGRRVQVEFVSANPTGPLHVGHGRGAAYGAVVANLLAAVGFAVQREYYVNDAGRQMDILAVSVWLRYLELCGEETPFPSNGYQGDYVWDIAASLHREQGDAYRRAGSQVFAELPPDEPVGNRENHIDALIARARRLLGDQDYRRVFERGLEHLLADIRDDLSHFGVEYDEWYSERSLAERGAVEQAVERLRAAGHLYERDGALWFCSSAFGDEKDRVVARDDGRTTYFASDIAYHLDKLARGFERLIDVWGADHHGYVPRVQAALAALGEDPDRLDVLLVQFASLYRSGERAPMSTRSGDFVTLRQLRKEVGRDAARFFYIMRRCEQHLDFDLDLAKSRSADNPVYYVQYAHARICSVLRQAAEKGIAIAPSPGETNLELLTATHERSLLEVLSRYPEVIEAAALTREPHQLAHYLRELANDFHTYYNAHQFLVENRRLRDARIKLILATRQTLRNGLDLIGVSAPETM
ncbi:MAG: arginine--tRNA ligase [Candidatus Thiosymbion ectosymbiont of Robbea hypermnestra]|nr:arginine--tRNA ligase [Candidatus Thiosymbion ectosymbiont of Robbea hypermnestra]